MVLDRLRNKTIKARTVAANDANRIVGDEPVTPLHQFKSGFTFTDAALSLYENTHPRHFDQSTVQQSLRCQRGIEKIGEDVDEFTRAVRADEHWCAVFYRKVEKLFGGIIIVRKRDARDRIIKIPCEWLLQFFGGNAADISMFALTKNLQAIVCEMLEKTVECEARPVDVDLAQLAIEIGVFIDEADLQAIRIF